VAKDAATAMAIAAGGVWALWKFVLKRKAHRNIQCSLEMNEIGRLGIKANG
jgi:hypothetical protein